jgi:hypothetical protein
VVELVKVLAIAKLWVTLKVIGGTTSAAKMKMPPFRIVKYLVFEPNASV